MDIIHIEAHRKYSDPMLDKAFLIYKHALSLGLDEKLCRDLLTMIAQHEDKRPTD
jgi:hypothetical protein